MWGYSRKKTNRGGKGVEDILFWKPPGIFHFFILPLEIPEKTKLQPWKFHKIVLDSLFFLVTLWNSTSFLINPWKFRSLFIWYPWKFHILNPACLVLFWSFELGTGAWVKMRRFNAFSNMNTINWKIFPAHGGQWNIPVRENSTSILERDKTLRSLKK